MGRFAHLERLLGDDLEAVQSSRLLVVGAGGIGCELLKNLALAGFRDLELMDLDTIDVSNLNRQFLFRSKHVGRPKALVAREAALDFNADMKVVAHHGNVKTWGVDQISRFDLVLNALDNVNARQHVNRLCLSAGVPLLDSGTTGYLGQTTVIHKGETQCYDCEPKNDKPKSFPICTIRNTPDKPVHCIVWAKELFKLLFGDMDESMLSGVDPDAETDATAGGDAAAPDAAAAAAGGDAAAPDGEAKTTPEEAKEALEQQERVRSAIMTAARRPSKDADADALDAYARGVFDAVFDTEIRLKLQMRDGYKGAKKPPAPLAFATATTMKEEQGRSGEHALSEQRVLPIAECAALFVSCVRKMWQERGDAIGEQVFDKDDAIALDFVTAASNLRSHVFGIERKSRFDVKGIAGNIVHAIATTNAIVAGLQVLEAIKVLRRLKSKPSEPPTAESTAVWVVREPIGSGMLLQASSLRPPNPKCVSCGDAVLTLWVDTKRSPLSLLVKALKSRLGIAAPTIMWDSNEVYAEGEGLEEDEIEDYRKNLPKLLVDCPAGGVQSGKIIDVEDFSQDLKLKLVVRHRDNEQLDEDGAEDRFVLEGEQPVAKAAAAAAVAGGEEEKVEAAAAPKAPGQAVVDDDDVQLVENDGGGGGGDDDDVQLVKDDGKSAAPPQGKRPAAAEGGPAAKRSKQVIELDD